eukprot:CAMPEP_0184318734 /NCGR_PEP_ID=MMETSP1049-20130417/104377_1 /TAXON_ID=77928 /ORGANISM="Proteomonas sulcata, Strain CCMP704" /LENGTH=87 /DNA_ID=CAMNT_0026638599 /DNA_START=331 /DNA_END=592 /DNA_ORIENTATION=+
MKAEFLRSTCHSALSSADLVRTRPGDSSVPKPKATAAISSATGLFSPWLPALRGEELAPESTDPDLLGSPPWSPFCPSAFEPLSPSA